MNRGTFRVIRIFLAVQCLIKPRESATNVLYFSQKYGPSSAHTQFHVHTWKGHLYKVLLTLLPLWARLCVLPVCLLNGSPRLG